MSLATANGNSVTRAVVTAPGWGLWWASFDLAEAVALTGAVSLVIADQTFVGTVWSGGVHDGRASYRIIAGAGGWGREIPAKGYADDSGVKVATVARDLALACGETIADVPTTRIGPHFERVADPASQTMHTIAPRAWYVDFAGVTRFGARTPTSYTGDAPRVRVDLAAGLIELATETLAGLAPGVIVDGQAPAADVEYALDASRLAVRVYSAPRVSRRLEAMRKIIEALDPRRAYRGVYEFRVVTQTGNRVNLQPVRVSSGMSDLLRVPVRPGVPGWRAQYALGEEVLVTFVDGDPGRPVVIAHADPDSPGWMPTLLEAGNAGDWIAQATKVGTELQRLRTWADVHVHPTGVGPSGAPATPTSAHESVACAKVKVL